MAPEQGERPGEGGLPDLARRLQEVQGRLAAASTEAGSSTVEGSAGGGVVRVVMTGEMELRSVSIDAAVVDPLEVEMLEDLLIAAFRDAVSGVHRLREQAVGSSLAEALGALGSQPPQGQDGAR